MLFRVIEVNIPKIWDPVGDLPAYVEYQIAKKTSYEKEEDGVLEIEDGQQEDIKELAKHGVILEKI